MNIPIHFAIHEAGHRERPQAQGIRRSGACTGRAEQNDFAPEARELLTRFKPHDMMEQ